MDSDALVREYLLLGLRFDRIESGYVDAFTGDPALRRIVENEPAPSPSQLARRAAELLSLIPAGLEPARADFVAAHLRALECAGRKFAGEQVGFVDEVRAYFDVSISKGDPERYRAAHARLDEALGGTGPLADRMQAYRLSDEIPPERLRECIDAFSSALRDRVRASFPLPDGEVVEYEVVTDKPWSGFNYYLGRIPVTRRGQRRPQAADVQPAAAGRARVLSRPPHRALPQGGRARRTCGPGRADDLPGEHPAVPDGRGARRLGAARGRRAGLGAWAAEIYADLGLRFDGERAEAVADASAGLIDVRQDAALMLHDEHRDADEVVAFLKRWLLVDGAQARQMLRFLSSPLWRAYISTYVEGYRLLREWLDAAPGGLVGRFTRLLDEPLIPSALR